MSDNIITPKGRLSFPNLSKPDLTPEQKFINDLAWCSITLAVWAKHEFENGAKLDTVKFRLKRAMELADRN